MTKRGYVEIAGVQDPIQGPPHTVAAYVLVEDFHKVAKYNTFKASLMSAAQQVLRKPSAVYEALRNVGREAVAGFCYVGQPAQIPNGQGGLMNLPKDRLVAVYVDKSLNVWEWGLERQGDDPLQPHQPEARFGKRLF